MSKATAEFFVYFPRLMDVVGPIATHAEACHEAGAFGLVMGPYPAKVFKGVTTTRDKPGVDPFEKRGKSAGMPTPPSSEWIEHMFRDLERPKNPLTTWELEFLTSIKDQFDRRGSLSVKQTDILSRIYEERTS